MYALYLKFAGYEAITASDGDIGIDVARRLKPDVIVMDLAIPGVSGITAVRTLRTDPRTSRIPIILLTGHAARAIQGDALRAGVDVFLTKPCLPEDLEHQVRDLLGRRRPGKRGTSDAALTPDTAEEALLLGPDEGIACWVCGNPIVVGAGHFRLGSACLHWECYRHRVDRSPRQSD